MNDEDRLPGSVLQRGYRVEGTVQGVGFRWWTRRTAAELGVGGSVRNLGDGSVEIRARGEASAIEELERRLRHGPPAARVSGVRAFPIQETVPEDRFEIRHGT